MKLMSCLQVFKLPSRIVADLIANYIRQKIEKFTTKSEQRAEIAKYSYAPSYSKLSYSTAQRQRRKRTQLFCDLRLHNELRVCVRGMRTSLDFCLP